MSDVIQINPAGRRAEAVRARQAARAVAPHITPSMLRPAVNACSGLVDVPEGLGEIGTGLAATVARFNLTAQRHRVPAAQMERLREEVARAKSLVHQAEAMLS